MFDVAEIKDKEKEYIKCTNAVEKKQNGRKRISLACHGRRSWPTEQEVKNVTTFFFFFAYLETTPSIEVEDKLQ